MLTQPRESGSLVPVLILYSILVICTIMVLGAAVFCYRHVRRHLRPSPPDSATPKADESSVAAGLEDQNR